LTCDEDFLIILVESESKTQSDNVIFYAGATNTFSRAKIIIANEFMKLFSARRKYRVETLTGIKFIT
jgi:hypothetical protein